MERTKSSESTVKSSNSLVQLTDIQGAAAHELRVVYGREWYGIWYGIGLLYNEAQQDAKVAQTTLTYILTVHRNEEIPVPDVSGFRSQTVES